LFSSLSKSRRPLSANLPVRAAIAAASKHRDLTCIHVGGIQKLLRKNKHELVRTVTTWIMFCFRFIRQQRLLFVWFSIGVQCRGFTTTLEKWPWNASKLRVYRILWRGIRWNGRNV